MTLPLRIAMAQLNLCVGDIAGNIKKHIEAVQFAKKESADVIIFPELSLTGYPPEDLLLRRDFLQAVDVAVQSLISHIHGIYCLVGHPQLKKNRCYNTCTLFYNGKIVAQYHKRHLPNYGVFDECRYFRPGKKSIVVNINHIPVGLLICEDLWRKDPIKEARALGAKIIFVPNASPFECHKYEQRFHLLTKRATENHISIVYANLVGGQDELVFDGGSMVMNQTGELIYLAPFFKETIGIVDLSKDKKMAIASVPPTIERIYQALCLGLHDYIEKNGIPGVLLGLSGGIDSALALCIAVDALGKDRVHTIMLPSRYTSDMSQSDAAALAKKLQVRYDIFSIDAAYDAFQKTISPAIDQNHPGIAGENIQARCRAVILMALSNLSNKIVLLTGNRSELAVGYCTLYGDMAGGYNLLKDIPKTMVYQLAQYRNRMNFVIPERILSRAPTAELAFNQKDEDSLPPYSELDPILEGYLNQLQSQSDIIAKGSKETTVQEVITLVKKSEYKRKQAVLGPHINHKSFGKDWRFPITNRWK